MNKQQILDYTTKTPYNTNPAVLSDMLDAFAEAGDLDTSDATATANDILSGKTAYAQDKKITGTMVDNSPQQITLDSTTQSYTIPAGRHSGTGAVKIETETKSITPTTSEQSIQASVGKVISSISVGAVNADIDSNITVGNIKNGVTILGVEGTLVEGTDTSDATAVATDILSGKTAYVNGSLVTGSITSKEAQTYTPTTSAQTIAAGQYLAGAQTITGDANLLPENIKAGVTIFGVLGTYTGETV